MIVNVVNPHAKSYKAPPCRICDTKRCRNCPLPIHKKLTLGELIAKVSHKTKYNGNANLFKDEYQLKALDTESDEESKDGFY